MDKFFKICYKSFFGIGCVLFFIVFSVMLIHTYCNDLFFPIDKNFQIPVSQMINPEKRSFSIAIASDSGAQNHVLEQVFLDAVQNQDTKPDFLLYLGDFVMRSNENALAWMLFELKSMHYGIPLYSVPGNHDVFKSNNVLDKTNWNRVIGPTYYWFGYGNILFIGLDTSDTNIENIQLNWLENTLKYIRPIFKHCVIYSHRPPKDFVNEKQHALNKDSLQQLEKILKRYQKQIDVMFFGHVHYFSNDKFAGIPMYTVPSSGQIIRSNIKKYGYIRIDFDNNGIKQVSPHYIDFHGDKREHMEFRFSRDIFDSSVQYSVTEYILYTIICFMTACVIRFVYRKRSK